ncbi:MAG: DsbA family protein, partial [Caulobacteraceae bacterium]|nr:DsbA family protein [Caulobacter sp.]
KVLVAIAAAEGLDATLIHRLLASGADEADTRAEIASAVRLGVSGVPFFIFAGRYAVPGAQEAHVLAGAIAKARERA